MQRIFQEAALSEPVSPFENPSEPVSKSHLLALPHDVLMRVVLFLSARDHAALSESHPFFEFFLLNVVPGLKLRLYPHQVDAIRKMRIMERQSVTIPMPLIHRFKVSNQLVCVVADLVDGSVYQLDSFPRVKRPCGGLFCDEPGLGKTITTLSHILKTLGRTPDVANRRETKIIMYDNSPLRTYRQPHGDRFSSFSSRERTWLRSQRLVPGADSNLSSLKRKVQPPDFYQPNKGRGVLPYFTGSSPELISLSSATLVIVPSVLTSHWMQQIDQHIQPGRLRVLRVHSNQNLPESAEELAINYDLVITTFDMVGSLCKETRARIPMLLKVHFYRLIVDEGHRLSSSQPSNFSVGCEMIKADIRWVMTGTPTPYTPRSDVEHLGSLLNFIGDESFGLDKEAWKVGIRDPYLHYKVESLERLKMLLKGLMIRADKSILEAKCQVRNIYLFFSKDTASSYNGLVRMGRRNLITSDWFSVKHRESFLNPRNRGPAHLFVSNLRKACCFGGSMDVQFYRQDVIDLLDLLYTDFKIASRAHSDDRFLDPGTEMHGEYSSEDEIMDWERRVRLLNYLKREDIPFLEFYSKNSGVEDIKKPRKAKEHGWTQKNWMMHDNAKLYIYSHNLERIGRSLFTRQGICDCCHADLELPLVTACGHMLCDLCVVKDKKGCVVKGCDWTYLSDEDGVPEDLCELQASMWSTKWVENWDQTESAKISYLLDRIKSLPPVKILDNGSKTLKTVAPKVIVHSEVDDHLKLVQMEMGKRDMGHSCVELVRNVRDTSSFVKKVKSSKEFARMAIKRFSEVDEANVLLMNSRLGGVGLDLSFVQYIFLLEPLWDAAQEMQIISRAHRIGCKQDISVERLIMRGSIEEDILRELQNCVNVVEVNNTAGVAQAKAEKDHYKRKNLLMRLKPVKSREEIEKIVRAQHGAEMNNTKIELFDEEVLEEEGHGDDYGRSELDEECCDKEDNEEHEENCEEKDQGDIDIWDIENESEDEFVRVWHANVRMQQQGDGKRDNKHKRKRRRWADEV